MYMASLLEHVPWLFKLPTLITTALVVIISLIFAFRYEVSAFYGALALRPQRHAPIPPPSVAESPPIVDAMKNAFSHRRMIRTERDRLRIH
jgi:hypothetical protein